MSENTRYIKEFYRGQQVELPALGSRMGHLALDDSISLQLSAGRQDMEEQEVMETVRAMQWSTLEYNGSRFQVGWLNLDNADHEEAVAFFPTFGANLSNAGNVFEFAYRATVMRHLTNRKIPFLYVSTFGREGSLALRPKELDHAKQTGSLLWRDQSGETAAVPTIQNLTGALGSLGVYLTRLRGESTGALVGLAVGHELPKEQITHTAFTSPVQITNRPSEIGRTVRMVGVEIPINMVRSKYTTPDKWQINRERSQAVKTALPDLYRVDQNAMSRGEAFRMLRGIAVILGHGIDGKDPLTPTLEAFFTKHPEAKVNLIVGTADPFHTHKLNENMQRLVKEFTDRDPAPFLRIIKMPGMTHSANTFYLGLYEELTAKLLELAGNDLRPPSKTRTR